MLSFAKRFLLVVTIVVAVTDLIEFYVVAKSPAKLTLPFIIAVIIITVIPIAVSLWYWLPKYKLKW